MFIGQLSKLTGASPKAIRHYEALGLLGRVARAGAYRTYTELEVQQVRLIRQAQVLGFRLAELQPFLVDQAAGPDWLGLARQIDRKRAAIREEIERLRQLDGLLRQVEDEIRSCVAAVDGAIDGGAACELPPGVVAGA